MDCLLIRPPFFRTGFDQDYQESLGIGYLASSIRKKGFTAGIIDGELQDLTPEEISEMIISIRPAVAGFSIMSAAAIDGAVEIAEMIRRSGNNEIHLTAGGHLPSFFPEKIMETFPQLDSLSIFEGEVSLPLLIENLSQNRKGNIPGMLLREDIKSADTRSLPRGHKNLDDIPFPARDILREVLDRNLPATVLTSRGCSGSCTFCSVVRFSMHSCGIPLRQRSPRNVVDELIELVRVRNVSVIHFIDDDFIGSAPAGLVRAKEIAELIIEENLKFLFYFECRPDHVEKDTFRILQEAGLSGVFLGIDSAVEETRKLYNKRSSMESVHEALMILNELNIQVTAGFIPFHPLTKFRDIEREHNFLFENNLDTLHTLMNRLYCTPELPVTRFLRKKGHITEGENFESPWDFTDNKTSLFFEIASTVLKPFFPQWYNLYRDVCSERNRSLISGKSLSGEAAGKLAAINDRVRQTVILIYDFVKEDQASDLLEFTRELKSGLKNHFRSSGEETSHE